MKNICVVFLLRGISACRLSWHGSAWVTSPNLERFAARSKIFDNHLSNSINPTEVDCTLFSKNLVELLIADGIKLFWLSNGDSSPRDGFLNVSCNSKEPLTWAIELRKCLNLYNRHGKLVVIEINQGLPPWELNRSESDLFFPHLNKINSFSSENDNSLGHKKDIDAELVDDFVEARPWDCDLPNYVDEVDDLTHFRIIETQAACLYGIDLFIEPMFQVINSEIGVLVLGDRGLEIGDRPQLGLENPWPWYTRVHVPCIWYDPRGDLIPQRICSFSHHGDVSETLAKFFLTNITGCHVNSMDLLELAKADTKSVVERPIISKGAGSCLGIRFRNWSLLKGSGEPAKLFKIPQDKWEVFNLASQHFDIVEQLLECIN